MRKHILRSLWCSVAALWLTVTASWLPSNAAPAGRAMPLFAANWHRGLLPWMASSRAWSVTDGVLSCSGQGRSVVLAPYQPRSPNYSIVARIRLRYYTVDPVVRADSFGLEVWGRSPINAGLGAGALELADQSTNERFSTAIVTDPFHPYLEPALGNNDAFTPGSRWHTYRLDVQGSSLHFSIDGIDMVDTTRQEIMQGLRDVNGRAPRLGTRLGLYSVSGAIDVSSFEVLPLAIGRKP